MKKLIILMFCLISAPVFSNYCATVFQYEGFSGAELDVFDGQKIRSLRSHEMDRYNNRSWDNKISSIEVQPNCKLVLFQYKFMGRDRRTNESIGAKKIFKSNHSSMRKIYSLGWFDNKASSLVCKCK